MPANLVLGALQHIWHSLEPFKLPMALMGGMALATWRHLRATRDIDILISLGSTNIDVLLASLTAANIKPKRQPPVLALGSLRVVQLQYEAPGAFIDIQVDLLVADSAYHTEALARRVPARLPELDLEIFVLSCEDLILHKLLAGRIIDRADAVALLRLNRAALDLAYLFKWSRNLGFTVALAEIWKEALPSEDLPPNGDGY